MKKILFIIISLISFSVQAVTAASDEDKYHFDNLEEVRSFINWQVNGWQVIDSRSLIVNMSASESYLLILDRDLRALKFTESIRISSTNSRVRSNIDQVHVLDQFARPSRIKTIYRLPNREARQNARAKILAEEIVISGEAI
ncbi:MAG: hypothetical protein COA71_08260 [SAR86 cluster bacterium]|uniref:Auto-transporter adhesin head GIN domain-containing protein n=1 Tax=SAR86 cluster bacterium TaxID=2030880 RepID=A0A2A5CDJ6_9GAMM|nr:MAG: hypothetical protein COA71_08260 [SAR86 cluster bacterium]